MKRVGSFVLCLLAVGIVVSAGEQGSTISSGYSRNLDELILLIFLGNTVCYLHNLVFNHIAEITLTLLVISAIIVCCVCLYMYHGLARHRVK